MIIATGGFGLRDDRYSQKIRSERSTSKISLLSRSESPTLNYQQLRRARMEQRVEDLKLRRENIARSIRKRLKEFSPSDASSRISVGLQQTDMKRLNLYEDPNREIRKKKLLEDIQRDKYRMSFD